MKIVVFCDYLAFIIDSWIISIDYPNVVRKSYAK